MEPLADAVTALAALITALTPLASRLWPARRVGTPGDAAPVSDHHPLTPPRLVLVQHDDGGWYPGVQDAWTRWPDGGWRASVTYSVAPGMRYLRSVPPERLRLP